MCSDYLVDPVVWTPASAGKKGIENQVGVVCERFFMLRLWFKNLDELMLGRSINESPMRRCITIWSDRADDLKVFEAERPKLVPYAGRFDGFHAVQASHSKTCLVRFERTSTR